MSQTRVNQNDEALVDIEDIANKVGRRRSSGGPIRNSYKDRKTKKEWDARKSEDEEVVIHHERQGYAGLFKQFENLSVVPEQEQEAQSLRRSLG